MPSIVYIFERIVQRLGALKSCLKGRKVYIPQNLYISWRKVKRFYLRVLIGYRSCCLQILQQFHIDQFLSRQLIIWVRIQCDLIDSEWFSILLVMLCLLCLIALSLFQIILLSEIGKAFDNIFSWIKRVP